MSSEAMAWAKRCGEVGSVPQLVLMLMADWADHENKAWPGVKTLASMTSRSERTIIRAVKRLEEAGLIEKSARTAWCALDNPACLSKGPHKHRTSNLYRLKVGAVPVLPAKGRAAPGAKEGDSKGDKMSLMAETAESCGNPISDKVSPLGSNSDISGRSIVTPVSPVCISDTKEIYPPDQTPPAPPCAVGAPDPGPVGSGTGTCTEDQEAAAVIAASPLAATAPPAEPAEPGSSAARPAGEGLSGSAVLVAVVPGPDPTRTQEPGERSAAQTADTAPRRPPERLSGQQAPSGGPAGRKARRSPSGESSGSSGGSGPDLALLGACLPEWALAMDARGARQVAALLSERIGGGWRPGEIRALMGEPPAGGARRMSALVAYRLRENVDPGAAPARAGEAVREAGERRAAERREATERAREAARTPEERAWDAAYAEAWAEAQSGLAGAPRLEVAEWAAERARAALAAGAGEAAV